MAEIPPKPPWIKDDPEGWDAEQVSASPEEAPDEPKPRSGWYPGTPSPNPSGRPKGIIDKRTRLRQVMTEGVEEIISVIKAAARDGDMHAANLILTRAVPPLRNEADRVEFDLDPSKPLADQAQQVLVAVSNGDIDPDTGKMMVDVIASLAGIRQVDDLERRIQRLEGR